MPNQEDLAFSDRFVFVSAPDAPPLTAVAVLNILTNNLSFTNDFPDFSFPSVTDPAEFEFLPPVIESVNNGDDILVRMTAADLSIVFELFANADGSQADITVRNLTMDPVDFADLGAYADGTDPNDFGLDDIFGPFGFERANPFDGLRLPDDVSFGGVFDTGLTDFASLLFDSGNSGGGDFGFGFTFDFGYDFSFGSGGGGFDYRDGFGYVDTDFSNLSIG